MNYKVWICGLVFIASSLETCASISRDSLQNLFPAGKIISTKENISCYRLNGVLNHNAYGYCIYDSLYTPLFTSRGTCYNQDWEEIEAYYNSNCYTIIPPIFSYALPFSDGWGAVCIDGKWSYVSADGTILCDFALDAAYPFKEGKAKVMYKGVTYDIDTYGNGLPQDISRYTERMTKRFKALTAVQLHKEHQYEMAIKEGQKLFNDIILCKNPELKDISADELLYAIQAQYAAISSQNSLMSFLLKVTIRFDIYQEMNLTIRFSPESGLYSLNKYNANFYFNLFKSQYPSDSTVTQILHFADEYDYKSSILLFEQWAHSRELSVTDETIELMVYYYLAELSNDFETANQLLVSIAELYEKNGFDWLTDTYQEGALLLNIRKYKSAKAKLEQASKVAKQNKNRIAEIVCNLNLALLYSYTGNNKECLSYYETISKLWSKIEQDTHSDLHAEILSNYIDYLLSTNLWADKYSTLLDDYIQLESSYNIKIFSSLDFLRAGRIWGKSNVRIQKILQHLENCHNAFYLSRAMMLSSFQQNILQDSEKCFLSSIRKSTNDSVRILATEYFALKNNFKGFDLFDESEANIQNKEKALYICQIEQWIRHILRRDNYLVNENDYLSGIKTLGENEVVIAVCEYTYHARIKKYGAFVVKGGNEIHYVPLGKETRFEAKDFWPILLNECPIKPHSICYMVLGKLDKYGIEYEEINNEDIAYFTYNIHRIHSLSCLHTPSSSTSSQRIALFGGLDYGSEFIAKTRAVMDDGYLEYSKYEIDTISTILDGKLNVSKFSDDKGTADTFRLIASQHPEVIHLATHGYQKDLNSGYWDINKDRFDYYRQFTDVENIEWLMNNTGVFLSFDKTDSTNVLCSRDVASCDLSQTRLVILSACSTISGKSSDSHMSPVSLTMAFAMAQTQNIITSLLNVYDKQTYEFMTLFYQKFNKTNDIYASFKETVRQMKHKYPQDRDIWGSFVLLENQH